MFHVFEQSTYENPNPVIREKFVCIEADTAEEADTRAEWFGLDFSGEDSVWCRSCSCCFTDQPEIVGRPPETVDYDDWVIVYRDGNMKSSFGMREQESEDRIENANRALEQLTEELRVFLDV